MKAIVYRAFGSPEVLQVEEVPKPTPQDNEILIKIKATSVNYGDLVARDFKHLSPGEFNMPFLFWLLAKVSFGLNRPNTNILGSEFSGLIEAIGSEVTRFKPGDPVFGYRGQSMGAYAEYLSMPEDGVVTRKPANMSFEEAAGIPSGGMTALNILMKEKIQAGDKVLINGASGGIGSHAVQLAKHYGAEVTGVCSTSRLDLVISLGADHVVDYTQGSFTHNGETYDLIFDVLGKSSFSDCKKSLKENGRYVLVSFKEKQLLQMLWTSLFGSRKVVCALSPQTTPDLVKLGELFENGYLISVIDRCFPLEETASAHRHVEAGHKKGHVIITVP